MPESCHVTLLLGGFDLGISTGARSGADASTNIKGHIQWNLGRITNSDSLGVLSKVIKKPSSESMGSIKVREKLHLCHRRNIRRTPHKRLSFVPVIAHNVDPCFAMFCLMFVAFFGRLRSYSSQLFQAPRVTQIGVAGSQ